MPGTRWAKVAAERRGNVRWPFEVPVMVPLFVEVSLIPYAVGCSLRRWREVSARLMVHPVSAMMQLLSSARSWKELELDTAGDELHIYWVRVDMKGICCP